MEWCCIAAVNDSSVLAQNLGASPIFSSDPTRLSIIRNQPSSSLAYNEGLDQTQARICVFAHQDVYLPLGWEEVLAERIEELDRFDPNWAVAGLYGIDRDGAHVGRVWDGSLGRELGGSFEQPIGVQSLDELLIILDRDKALRFDTSLPSFHLYGADVVQTARSRGHGAFVIHAPVVHNSLPVAGLHGGFMHAYDYMRRKWRHSLPIITPVTRVTRSGLAARWKDFRRYQVNFPNRKKIHAARGSDRANPQAIARTLGYE